MRGFLLMGLLVAGLWGTLRTEIDSMDEIRFSVPVNEKKEPRGRAELVEGKEGKAVRFSFYESCSGAFFARRIRPEASWDASAGISFWLRGDGSDHMGGMEWIAAEDFRLRYAAAFSIEGQEWRRVVIPWRDILPETATAPFLGAGMKPSAFGHLWFGKWWYWKDYAAHSFTVDAITLEPRLDLPPDPPPPSGPPLKGVSAKLRSGQPVTIVTMGDSLTDFAHWANRETNWPTLLKQRLEQEYGSRVTLVNSALGGTELKTNLVLMPRWTGKVRPDLVTVLFGYNDWSSGMRGPHFRETLIAAVDRIRRMTGAEVLLVTTVPALERWTEMAELAQAVREAARERNAGLADAERAFHEAGDADPSARAALFCRDRCHLGAPGHRRLADAVFEALRSPG